jgi:MinD superfamily P-loop ATPase
MENNKNLKLVILSGKGGVGKSMLASALAMLFSPNKKVVALDCDADAPNLAIWLGGVKKWDKILPVIASAKPEIDFKKCNNCGLCAKNCRFGAIKMENDKPQLNSFLCEGCGACEVICSQKAIKLKPVQNGEIKIKKTKYGFPLIVGQLYPGESGSGKVVDQIKAEANKFNSELAILDSAPGTGCPVTAALRDSNFAILISEPTPSGFTDLKRVLEIVNYFKIPYGIVINKWDINSKLSNKIEKWAGKKFLGKISYDQRIFKAISNLTPILETNLKAKKEIKNIFKKLNQIIGVKNK